MAQGARKNQIKALQDTLLETEKESGDKEEENNIAKEDLAKTTADRTADKTFMDDLTSQCEEKATAWDARSKTRAAELTAIAAALDTLKGEVSGNYAANKKLTAMVSTRSKVSKPVKGHWVWVEDKEPTSFLQKKQA